LKIKTLGRLIAAMMLAFSLGACSTVTIRELGGEQLSTEPTYQSSKPYFVFGLIGSHDINVREICGGARAIQMQAQDTFVDRLLGIVTLWIYTPRTAKVWCEQGRA
jgi:hypothetical protein